MTGLIARPFVFCRMVYPSGGDFATASAPTARGARIASARHSRFIAEPPRAAFGPGLSTQLSLADARACIHPVCDREGRDAFAALTPPPPAPGSHPPK